MGWYVGNRALPEALTKPGALRQNRTRRRPPALLAMQLLVVLTALVALLCPALPASGLYDLTVKDIHGKDVRLDAYRGKVLLIVNVASECGYVGQYAGLGGLYSKYKERGLVVLGFPCNQFAGQEPGTEAQILQFCTSRYRVKFPLFSKIDVNGPGRHPLYTFLSGDGSPFPGEIGWNFSKFLVGRDGRVLARFESKVTPESEELRKAIEAALAAK